MVSAARLLRALAATATPFGLAPRLELVGETPWTSATFTGAWHVVRATAARTGAVDHWIESLSGFDLRMPGQVASPSIAARDDRGGYTVVTIEALTLAE